MSDADLDEVDLSLLDTIAYVRRYGLSPEQVARCLFERLAAALEMADALEDDIEFSTLH